MMKHSFEREEQDGRLQQAQFEAELFHEGSKLQPATVAPNVERIIAYMNVPRFLEETAANRKTYPTAMLVDLPREATPTCDLSEALKARVSARKFSSKPIDLRDLAKLMYLAYFPTRTLKVERLPTLFMEYRPYPSGGGLYPVELYIIVTNGEGISPGVYHVRADLRALEFIQAIDLHKLSAVCVDRSAKPSTWSALCVMTAVLPRTITKYAHRGYRFALLEAGHLGQNICLSASALGIGSLVWGAYFDDRLSELIGINTADEIVVSAIILGTA